MIFWLLVGTVSAALFAALIYPGELSLFGPKANRWLYDRSARNYESKWGSSAYANADMQARIDQHVEKGLQATGLNRVLDLGCGTGRALQLSDLIDRSGAHYTGIDFSPEMLAQFQQWLATDGQHIAPRIELIEQELGEWANQTEQTGYGALFLLEVGEFLPAFIPIVQQIARVLPPGAALVMTRPANMWWLFFPRRKQSRRALSRLLISAGFTTPEFLPWRSRYEFVLAIKNA